MSNCPPVKNVPLTIDVVIRDYEGFVRGVLKNQQVRPCDMEDALQDVWVHLLSSKFFVHVAAKVQAGALNLEGFKSYLAATIHNCIVNGWKRDGRDPAIGAVSTSATDDENETGTVDLETFDAEQTPVFSIPTSVMERDIIRYVAERKAAFVPTLILHMQNLSQSEIANAIGKRKETIHYRMKELTRLLTEYMEEKRDDSNTDCRKLNVGGPLYVVKKSSNPYADGIFHWLWEAMVKADRPVSFEDLVTVCEYLSKQGKYKATHTPSEIVSAYLAESMKRGCLCELAASLHSESGSGGRDGLRGPRLLYRLVETAEYGCTGRCGYRWGIGYEIYERLKMLESFDFNTLRSTAQALLDGGVISSSRNAEGVGRGFIETARGYGLLKQWRETLVDACAITTAITLVKTPQAFMRPCPYTRGLNYLLWQELKDTPDWTLEDVTAAAMALVEGGARTRRSAEDIAYAFYYEVRRYEREVNTTAASQPAQTRSAPTTSARQTKANQVVTVTEKGRTITFSGLEGRVLRYMFEKPRTRRELTEMLRADMESGAYTSKRRPEDMIPTALSWLIKQGYAVV